MIEPSRDDPDPGGGVGRRARRVFHSKVDTIRPTYGFEDVSLAPGTDTVEPADVDLAQTFCGIDLAIPILASAMDAVVDARMAGELGRLGGLAILNLEGVQARYDEPDAVLERIARPPTPRSRTLLAEAYQQPIREDLIAAPPRRDPRRRVARRPSPPRPGAARRFGPFCAEHGADLFLVQSQVSSARHLATDYDPLSLADFTRYMPIPVAVGNTTNAEAAFALMEQGAAAVFVGVGPGCGVHDPRGPRHRRPAGHRDQRRGRGARRVPRRDRPLRPGRRRRRDAPRRRAGQGDRRRRRRADDRLAAGPRRGGARPRHELGDGRPVADPAARHADQGRDRRARSSGSCSVRRTSPTAARTWSARCASRWPRSGPGRSARCSGSRWSTRRRPRPRASPGSGAADRNEVSDPMTIRADPLRFAVLAVLVVALVTACGSSAPVTWTFGSPARKRRPERRRRGFGRAVGRRVGRGDRIRIAGAVERRLRRAVGIAGRSGRRATPWSAPSPARRAGSSA